MSGSTHVHPVTPTSRDHDYEVLRIELGNIIYKTSIKIVSNIFENNYFDKICFNIVYIYKSIDIIQHKSS